MSGNANRAFRLVQALGDDQIGLEARAQADDHQDVKIWLRLLACCLQIESQVRQHLRRFGTTLPRFDFLAQLDRHPDGLRMTALSHYLMVTGGNVTGLADQLVQEGLVERLDDAEDRRCTRVRLTLKGRTESLSVAGAGRRGHHHAEPPGAQEPADFRQLRRTARPVPSAQVGGRRQGHGRRRRWRQLLLRRRRARDHRAADRLKAPELLKFTRMTGDLVKAMRTCPQPIVAAVDGVCAGAGAIVAMSADMRLGTARSKTAFLFNRVGLAGCDMGACAILPRIIGQGRASELLYTGRALGGEEGERWGFFNRSSRPSAARRGAGAGRRTGRRADLRQRHDQDDAASGVVDDDRAGDRVRGAGAGDLHAHRRLLARLPRLRGQAEAEVRRQLTWPTPPIWTGPSSSRAMRNWRGRCTSGRASTSTRTTADLDAECRAWCAPWAGRLAAPRRGRHGAWRRRRGDRHARHLPDPRDARPPQRAGRLRLRHAGLGSGAISLPAAAAQRERYLPARGGREAIAAFALSEPEAGSDVAAMACSARADGDGWVLDGEKTWISNGGIADFYVVFARTGERPPGARGISAFVVDAGHAGLRGRRAHRRDRAAPAGAAALRRLRVARKPAPGAAGEGFKVAMRTLDVFRTSVAAAALGFAVARWTRPLGTRTTRRCSGGVLADFQLTQAKLAQMATAIDSAALLTYRAAWLRDRGQAGHARGRDGQDDRHRRRAAGHRRRGADVRAAWAW
jgi:enoyl-CoA hydratase/carnithine racemase/DNA-binding MarR family transcriptional regulator